MKKGGIHSFCNNDSKEENEQMVSDNRIGSLQFSSGSVFMAMNINCGSNHETESM